MDQGAMSLAQIADESGFTPADVAALARLERSTVTRLWDDSGWLERISGATLTAIIGVLPGVAEYVTTQALHGRRTQLVDGLGDHGLRVDEALFQRLVRAEGVPEQYLSNALQTVELIMAGDVDNAAKHLMRFWGRAQDYALGFAFEPAPRGGLIGDPTTLINASAEVADRLAGRTSSFHAIVGRATLIHHVARAHGTLLVESPPGQHQTAFIHRSATIGMILQTNDVELVDQYRRDVEKTHLLGMIEDWSFPTYMRDAPPTRDFGLPRGLLLRQTAAEVVSELGSFNDAYVHYLASVYLPRALRRDPTFGLQLPELVAGLRARLEQTTEPAVRRSCTEFLKLVDQVERIPAKWQSRNGF